jgi:transcriptional regulator with XRE-family HTH domain
MSALNELGIAVRARRSDMGLTQAALAKLTGLSRATVNQLETGMIGDLSLKRAAKLLETLGLSMVIDPMPVKRQAASRRLPLEIAAGTASVSYRVPLNPEQLRQALTGSAVPKGFTPHVHALLDEAPVALLASVADQLHEEAGIEPAQAWKRMRELAKALKSRRPLWQ